MTQNQKPQHSPLQQQEQPEQRLARLTAQRQHSELLHQLTQHEGYQELRRTMKTELTRRKAGQYAIHFDSTPEEFMRFEKRALYMAGYVQGLEFGLNVLDAAPQQKANLDAEIKKVEADIKAAKKRRS